MTKIHLVDAVMAHNGHAQRALAQRNRRLRILISYHYFGKEDLDTLLAKHFTEPYPEVFLDSGAFSAKTQGVAIDINAYVGFIKRNAHHLSTYSVLDVIGDAKGTRENQKRMEDMGVQPLPCWHTGETWDDLEWYIERYPYIAIGGMVPYLRFSQKLMPWLVQAFKQAKGRAVFHGFGATSWKIASMVPWYSVDSSSWAAGVRFGQVDVFDYRAGRFRSLKLGKAQDWIDYGPLVRSMGFDPKDFADRARNKRETICGLCAVSYMEAERWLKARHGEIMLPQRPTGLRLFMANPQLKDFTLAQQGIKEAGR
jgi:hypothetical protein